MPPPRRLARVHLASEEVYDAVVDALPEGAAATQAWAEGELALRLTGPTLGEAARLEGARGFWELSNVVECHARLGREAVAALMQCACAEPGGGAFGEEACAAAAAAVAAVAAGGAAGRARLLAHGAGDGAEALGALVAALAALAAPERLERLDAQLRARRRRLKRRADPPRWHRDEADSVWVDEAFVAAVSQRVAARQQELYGERVALKSARRRLAKLQTRLVLLDVRMEALYLNRATPRPSLTDGRARPAPPRLALARRRISRGRRRARR